MNRCRMIFIILIIVLGGSVTPGATLGDVRGVVQDPNQHPVSGAKVTLRARTSGYFQTGQTNGNGEFAFRAVPIGEYLITVESSGFAKIEQPVTVISDSAPVLKIQLQIASFAQGVEVIDRPELVGSDSPTPTTLISRRQIE